MQKKSKKIKKFLRLEYYRKKYGLKQEDMAMLLGVCKSSYSHKETARTPFSHDELLTIHGEINKRATKAGDQYISLDEIFLP